MAAFGFLHQMTEEPLLKQLLRYVMSDEARHVAFGVLSLKEAYAGMSDQELMERQEFAFEAAIRMRDRFLSQEVWEKHGVNPRDVVPLVLNDPTRDIFQQMLFSKIVPNCKKLGLLDRNDKWLRHRFEEMNVIQFEDWEDTGSEYIKFELGGELPEAQPVAGADSVPRRGRQSRTGRYRPDHACRLGSGAVRTLQSEQRAQPFWDLVGLVRTDSPLVRCVDLGCGTGELTAGAAARWAAPRWSASTAHRTCSPRPRVAGIGARALRAWRHRRLDGAR